MIDSHAEVHDRRFKSPAEGLRELERTHEYWSERVTDISFQSSVGLIAGNWALHSANGALLKNHWALCSVALAIFALLAALLGAWLIAGETRKQYYVAVSDREAWAKRWESSERIDSEWPYTKHLAKLGATFRTAKAILPILGGIAFVIGAITT